MKKVLICGASGFIGKNLAENLSKRGDLEVYGTYNTRETSIPGVYFYKSDLTDVQSVREITKGKDIVIQMASVTSGVKDVVTKPHIHITDNAIMNSLLLRAAFENNVGQFIFPSCSTLYTSSDKPIKEEDMNPNDIYPHYFGSAKTKLYIEEMCNFFSRLGRTRHTVFRHSNIYGPHDKYDLERSHVFGATITKVMSAKAGDSIKVWGTGEEERDLLYVDDLVDFVYRSFDQKTPFELVNVGLGKGISVGNLVKKIIAISGKESGIEYDASKPTIKTKIFLDSSKAREKFGWAPQIDLDEGIRRTIEWYRDNIK